MKKTVVCLVGPTAVGKTEVALKLARKIRAEIISCDSMQIYRGIDIATSKPTKLQRRAVRHHLIDVVSPAQEYNAARFSKSSRKIIQAIHKKGKLPLIVGGTGLYLRALLDGLFLGPGKNLKLRHKFYQQAQRYGPNYLHQRLKACDPQAAAAIHPHDTRRVVRALEVYQQSGQPISQLQKKTSGVRSKYNLRIFGLSRPRNQLYARIEKRVEAMFKRGLVAEMTRLNRARPSPTAQSLLGYKEIKGLLDGQYSRDQAEQLLKRNTRHYAKRQLTWLRKEKDVRWIKVAEKDTAEVLAKKIVRMLN